MASPTTEGAPPPPGGMKYTTQHADLDESFYEVDEIDEQFLEEQTGIKDPEEVKKHLIQVQREVYAIHPYPCIRLFHFAKLKICRFTVYPDLLKLGKEREGALFLDVGCGVGNDTRKVVADGFPANQVIASDLHSAFWEIGHKVFRSTPERFPVKFVAGDVFDPAFLAPGPLATEPPAREPAVDLASLTSLTPLRGRLSAIHASSFFHLFSEDQQAQLARLLASLLSPEPGSMILGAHVGRPEKGLRMEFLRPNAAAAARMFCHSPESFVEMWDEVFGAGRVKTAARLLEVERKDEKQVDSNVKFYIMGWSVKRL